MESEAAARAIVARVGKQKTEKPEALKEEIRDLESALKKEAGK